MMKRIKILFCINQLEMTGASVSLLSLLRALDYSKYDVSLFTFTQHDTLGESLPMEVKRLPSIKDYEVYAAPLSAAVRKCLTHGWLWLLARRVIYSMKERFVGGDHKIRLAESGPGLPGTYDIAIAFCCSYVWQFIVDKVEARHRVAWLDTERRFVDHQWRRFARPNNWDVVACVGEGIRASLLSECAAVRDKTCVVHNVIDRHRIEQVLKDAQPVPMAQSGLRIVTVGRITDQKGQDLIIKMAQRLKAKGVVFDWYLVGPCLEKWNLFMKRAGHPDIEDCLHYCDRSNNPYGWMKGCDLYVQPSRCEGWGMTVTEALAVGCPVMVSDIPAFHEQVRQGENGWIVPLEVDAFVDAIVNFKNGKLNLTRRGVWLEDYSTAMDFDRMCEKVMGRK